MALAMQPREFRAAAALAAVFSVRLLGLFMIYPVFAAYAGTLSGANPYLIGEALGIYGLTQGILQIPFGLLSDRVGRKVMIVTGLALFGIGSAVAAVSTSMGGVIVGRALQGVGAVGSVILALLADLTGEESRTAAMAMVGITIGASFLLALLAGPIVASFIGVSGIFWLMVALAIAGMAITEFVVPKPPRIRVHRDAEAVPALIGSVLRNGELLRLDIGIFVPHAMLTASFLVLPDLLRGTLGVAVHDQWIVYLPVLLVAIAAMVPAIIAAEKYRHMKGVFVSAVAALVISQIMLYFDAGNTPSTRWVPHIEPTQLTRDSRRQPLYPQKRTLISRAVMSALCQKQTCIYWMTSSARPISDSGTVRSSALAVLRLMTSSYFVGACTGRSPGFSPLRIRST